MTRPTIVAGNWKLNPPRQEGERLFQEVFSYVQAREPLSPSVKVIIVPPYPYLGVFATQAFSAQDGVQLGAQDIATELWGPYTGEIGAPLLKEFGVTYALVGHSERRHRYAETDADAAAKVRAAAGAGLTPILCIGETEAERDAAETFEVVERQLRVGLEMLPDASPFVLAYEPVWAIGTGRTATREQAAEVHRFIRHRVDALRGREAADQASVLYGGSVKADNAASLIADKDIDGFLIGGASLRADSFVRILDESLSKVAR